LPDLVKVGALAEGEKPNKGAHNDNGQGVEQESVVEDNESDRDMISLDNSANRDDEGYKQGNSEYGAS